MLCSGGRVFYPARLSNDSNAVYAEVRSWLFNADILSLTQQLIKEHPIPAVQEAAKHLKTAIQAFTKTNNST